MLELGDTELELVPLTSRDEAKVAEDVVQRLTHPLADSNRIAAPARRRVVDPSADFFLAQPAALGERVGKLVRPLRRQRDGAYRG
jgi:hypothetical protein